MDTKIRHDLMSMESQDIVQQRFERIHSKGLSARRAREINTAAKQAREYFRNSSNADYSVRPLLTYYGVASLSRALVLLLRAEGGEECLKPRHGLETVGWRKMLPSCTSTGLRNLRLLKIRSCGGLFSDFVVHTRNTVLLKVGAFYHNSGLSYDIPDEAVEISVDDLFRRFPDVEDYSMLSGRFHCAVANDLSFNNKDGLRVVVVDQRASAELIDYFISQGYNASSRDGTSCVLSCDMETALKGLPLFIHTYLNKGAGWFHFLHMAKPFPRGACYSQLCITYMVSYILGMLARYYPTHWMALIHGSKGDSLWPTMSRAQEVVEHTFPELVAEFIRWKVYENGEAKHALPTKLDEDRAK